MKSKTSAFNKTVFLKNIKRFWPLWFGYFAVWFVALPLMMSSSLRWGGDFSDARRLVYSMAQLPALVIALLTAILSSTCVWSFMYSSRSMSGMASLPIRREGVFLSLFASAMAPVAVINAVIAVITLGFEAIYGAAELWPLVVWFLMSLGETVFFTGFAFFCAQLTGNIIVLPVLYLGLNFTAYVVEILVRQLVSLFAYGIDGLGSYIFTFLAPPIYIAGRLGSRVEAVTMPGGATQDVFTGVYGVGAVAVYAAVGVVFFAAAILLYRRRAMETAGDVVAIPVLRPIFKYCMTFGGALCIGFLLYSLTGVGYRSGSLATAAALLAFMLVGAFIGYFLAKMLIKKSFRVFSGDWKGLIISAAVIIFAVFSVQSDIFGISARVPDAQSVASVAVTVNGDRTEFSLPENIETAEDIHRSLISNRSLYESSGDFWELDGYDTLGGGQSAYVSLVYSLSNGRTLSRSYSVLYAPGTKYDTGDIQALQELINTPEGIAYRKETKLPITADTIIDCTVSAEVPVEYAESLVGMSGVTVYDHGMEDTTASVSWSFTSAEAAELYSECILPDIEDGTIGRLWIIYDGSYADSVMTACISIDSSTPRDSSATEFIYDYFYTYPTVASSRTNAWLESHGVKLFTNAELEN